MGDYAKLSKTAQTRVRVLTLDIETTPNLAYVWGLFKQNVAISQLEDTTKIFCFVAKWYDSKEVIFRSDHHDGHDGMINALYELICEADIVVTYNGISFDMPHINREFLLAGYKPPTPYKDVDLIRTVRRQFRFTSNKLDHVAQQLGLGQKTQHTGFQLWRDCMLGDEQAWALMRKYNIQDVKLTEKLYDRLRPWIPNHPHLGMWTGEEWSCPNCGHKNVSQDRAGTAHTNVQRYRQYRCPKCGHVIRGTKKLQDPTSTRSSK